MSRRTAVPLKLSLSSAFFCAARNKAWRALPAGTTATTCCFVADGRGSKSPRDDNRATNDPSEAEMTEYKEERRRGTFFYRERTRCSDATASLARQNTSARPCFVSKSFRALVHGPDEDLWPCRLSRRFDSVLCRSSSFCLYQRSRSTRKCERNSTGFLFSNFQLTTATYSS